MREAARTQHQKDLKRTDMMTAAKVAVKRVKWVIEPGMMKTYRERKPVYADGGTGTIPLLEPIIVAGTWLLEEPLPSDPESFPLCEFLLLPSPELPDASAAAAVAEDPLLAVSVLVTTVLVGMIESVLGLLL